MIRTIRASALLWKGRRLSAAWVLLVALTVLPMKAAADADFYGFDIDFLRIPTALGFFPFGGNATVRSNAFTTYVGGPAFDFINWVDEDEDFYGNERRIKATLLNLTCFLVGFDWTALQRKSMAEQTATADQTRDPKTAQFINLAYLRAGPHFALSFPRAPLWRHGVEVGYGVVLVNEEEGFLTRVKYLHGLDVSYTWSFALE